MKKIATVVGARPQFIKAAMVSSLLREFHKEVLIHTGQHYDYNMSGCFFDELSIPIPDYNLGISGGTHAQMTGKMMAEIEAVLFKEKPDELLVYGDTNSTLAAALVAAKLGIPIHHVEAGIRTHSMTNPEEINRICTDQVSSCLYASTESSMREMEREGLASRAIFTGDLMYDAYLKYVDARSVDGVAFRTLDGGEASVVGEYYYLTCHRQENTEEGKLVEILLAMNDLSVQTVYPVHPRNAKLAKKIVESLGLQNILLIEPVGYLESLALLKSAKGVVTDSGGLQREAFFAGKKCVTVLDFVVWPETMVGDCNVLAKPIRGDILGKLMKPMSRPKDYKPFGNGDAHKIIVNHVNTWM